MGRVIRLFVWVLFVASMMVGCMPSVEATYEVTPELPTSPALTIELVFDTPTVIVPTSTPTLTPQPTETKIPLITIVFTGVIAPSRCVQASIDERGGDANYIYAEVREVLSSGDITVGVYNSTMRAVIEHIGCQRSWELVGGPENADALQWVGFDVMSVATNHIKDCGRTYCGDEAFFDTLENLLRVNILPVGGGEDLDAAMQPVVVEVQGVRFGFVSLGDVNERVFADKQTPGIAVLTYLNLEKAIEAAREVCDVVIVLPHSGPEDYPEPTLPQLYWGRNAVALGADLVVMNHAHVVQGYQVIDGVHVFYGLGNFVFDQVWARDHQQGVILRVTFQETDMVGFEFIPTIVDQDGTVHLAEGSEAQEILDRIEALSQAISNSIP